MQLLIHARIKGEPCRTDLQLPMYRPEVVGHFDIKRLSPGIGILIIKIRRSLLHWMMVNILKRIKCSFGIKQLLKVITGSHFITWTNRYNMFLATHCLAIRRKVLNYKCDISIRDKQNLRLCIFRWKWRGRHCDSLIRCVCHSDVVQLLRCQAITNHLRRYSIKEIISGRIYRYM